MVTELHLEGLELVAYALVHQFSQKSQAGLYTGGVPYLAYWLSISDLTARKYLHQLEEKGLIMSRRGSVDGVPYCYYKVIDTQIPKIFGDTPKNFTDDPQKICVGTPKKFGVDNNIDSNKIVNILPPTPQEVSEYAKERGFTDPEGFAAHFIDYYKQTKWHLANGKPMKDWRRAVITWEPNNKFRNFGRKQQPRQVSHENPNDFWNR